MNKNIMCPYCNSNFNNSLEYLSENFERDGDENIINCDNCNKRFKIVLNIEYSFDSERLEEGEIVHNE